MSPEELLAAAHAACYNHALANLFQDLAERARVGCAFSKALVLEPTLTARLVA